ncbi:hypothetical protein PRK78_001482 [Emydomyces testavorans]|uniref:Zn(2)-C6 fungal-type domain-containing protein n=1 Tax=Emydomyces testavorans TaxID=2070801 RepID=A0AAF0DEK5_9EURO|nr:hypothetical protein PRK78_001482 [Emydomyces testavorans]
MLDNAQTLQTSSTLPEQPKRLACERCRGQKLRCIRNRINQLSCNRCERAGAVCITKPSMRMGRPGRSDTQRKESIANRKRRQSNSASNQQLPEYNTTSGKTSNIGTRSNSPTHDSATPGLQGMNGPRPRFASHLPSTDVQEMPDAEFAPFSFMGEGENPDVEVDSMSWLNYNTVEMNMLPIVDKYEFFRPSGLLNENSNIGPGMIHAAPQSPPSPNRDSDSGFQNIVSDFTHLGTRPTVNFEGVNMLEAETLFQDSLERLARLNLDVSQQLKLQQSNDWSTTEHNSLAASPPEPTLPIANIIRGLQEFQEVLQNFVNFQNARSIYESNSDLSRPNLRATEIYDESPLGSTHSLAALSISSSSSDESLLPIIIHTSPIDESNTRQSRQCQLDVPTSLSMLMCYINLVRLCRSVFSNIRHCLVALNHRAVSIALSDIQIGGVSLQGDQNLQILVLVQVVVRMLDCIGTMLGRTTPSSTGQGNDEKALYPLISPKLMEIAMGEEELNKQQTHAGGIKALREDIRKLKRVLKCT